MQTTNADRRRQPSRPPGFALLELCITLAIIALICSSAYPAYREISQHGRRTEAKIALINVMQQQEYHHLETGQYSEFSAQTATSHPPSFTWWSGASPETGFYRISAIACQNSSLQQCILLIAEPVKMTKFIRHDDTVCGNFMLNSFNQKSYSGNGTRIQCW